MYQRNIVAETRSPRATLFPMNGVREVDLRQLSDEDIDKGIHFMSDEPGMGVDPFALFAARLSMANT